jgi:ABC-2 type transport system ATP-binding protein
MACGGGDPSFFVLAWILLLSVLSNLFLACNGWSTKYVFNSAIMISINGVTKTFNKKSVVALNNVSCGIASNKVVGFIGPDGAGKTTLLRIMAGILVQDNGEVLIDNRRLDIACKASDEKAVSLQELHQMIAYMPQKFGLYEDLSVMENLELYGRLHGIRDEERQESFDRVLEVTKLAGFSGRLTGNLSGGMKQKLGLACALLKKPKILILDEPSVGVDPISRKDLIGMVNSMLSEETTVLWSTAYLDEAEELDHVILLSNGSVIFEGSPSKAKSRLANRVYLFCNVRSEKRSFSAELLKNNGVVDSIIIGQDVKIVTRDEGDVEHICKSVGNIERPKNVDPTFEDACIDILGGVTEKHSPIEEYMSATFDGNALNGPVVEAMGLTKRFGDFTAVDNVSFTIGVGKILGLLGPNGSGKSTTFRMLCGLLKQSSGTARIVGIDIMNLGSEAKLKIGYMAQKFSLYPMLSVRQNLEFFSGIYGLKGTERKDVVRSMIDIFHFGGIRDVNTCVLSLGYKQRLALACSIMHRPRVLFLDEPTSGVDPITRREFWMHINAMVRYGVSVVVTTHFMDEAENCDEIALIYKGKIRASGTPSDLKSVYQRDSRSATLEQAFMNVVKETDERAMN